MAVKKKKNKRGPICRWMGLFFLLALWLGLSNKKPTNKHGTFGCPGMVIPRGPKWLKHLLRRCFGVVLGGNYLLRCLDP